MEELFKLEELIKAARTLKNGKAPGNDGIPSEILKEVIAVYPELLLNVFNACLKAGEFFSDWKVQKLVLLRKGNKPLDEVSSFRTICLLHTMGKLLEAMVLERLQRILVGENSLLENQFGFRKGRSTVDAILSVVNLAKEVNQGSVSVLLFPSTYGMRLILRDGTSALSRYDKKECRLICCE